MRTLPAGDPDVLHNPLRLRGAKLVMDYPIDQRGTRVTKYGAILVEGTWYSPGMPKRLINATLAFRTAMQAVDDNPGLTKAQRRDRAIALEYEWRELIAQRSKYRVREKEKPDAFGRVPMMRPVVGKTPLMTCPLQQLIEDSCVGTRALMPVLSPPKALGAICTNKTSTSFNGYVKNDATFALDKPARRRMRGITAQSILSAIVVTAANIKKIREWLAERELAELDDAEGFIAPPAARKRRIRKGTLTQNLEYRARKGQRMNRGQTPSPLRT